jgi:hypothetical protein
MEENQIPPGTAPPTNDAQQATFTERTFAAYEAMWKQLAKEIPELDGVAVTFVWRPELHQAKLPHAQTFAKNNESNNPSFLLRAMEQMSKTLANLNQRFHGTLVAGEAAAVELNNKIAELRAQNVNQPATPEPTPGPRTPVNLFRDPNDKPTN